MVPARRGYPPHALDLAAYRRLDPWHDGSAPAARVDEQDTCTGRSTMADGSRSERRMGAWEILALLTLLGIPSLVWLDTPFWELPLALRELAGRWTHERLDAFLADPGGFAPGTSMTFRLASPEDRAAVIEFLATLP